MKTQQKDVIRVLPLIRRFVSANQIEVMADATRREEGQHFKDKFIELANTFNSMPKTYEQDGKGDQAMVYLHYFTGSCDWYITERDMEEEQLQAFGWANLGNGMPELGYISITELARLNVEIDLHFSPKPLAEIKADRAA